METILYKWNAEKIMLMANHPQTAVHGRVLAFPERWELLDRTATAAWGQLTEENDKYRVALNLFKVHKGDLLGGCACNCSESKPCKHALGMLFLLVEQPGLFADRSDLTPAAADMLGEDYKKTLARYMRGSRAAAELDETNTIRLQRVKKGMAVFQTWLEDLVRQGLAAAHVQDREFWKAMSDRLVDAELPRLARELREVGQLPHTVDEWLDPVLMRLGRFYLMTRSFERYDLLEPEARADLRSAIGWQLRLEEVGTPQPVEDVWWVIGQRAASPTENVRERDTWLYGSSTQRMAHIHEVALHDDLFEASMVVGDRLTGALVFLPSQAPLRAHVSSVDSIETATELPPGRTIADSIASAQDIFRANPWQNEYPVWLTGVLPTPFDEGWALREVDGTYLPLADNYGDRWLLLALSGGRTMPLGGIWDGIGLFPLSVKGETGTLVDLEDLKWSS